MPLTIQLLQYTHTTELDIYIYNALIDNSEENC